MRRITPAARKRLAILGFLLLLPVATMIIGCIMPGRSYQGPWVPLSKEEALLKDALRRDVEHLAGTIGERSVEQYAGFMAAKGFLESSLRGAGYEARLQEYEVSGKACFNIEAEIRGKDRPKEIVVIGAHYDSVEGCPAANDNGTGTAAVLALARVFAGAATSRTLRFVCFANEEPPRFTTELMGSRVYARRCRERKEDIVAMLSLETIGWYSDEKESQKYPFPFSLVYPSTGNFIGFVGNLSSYGLVRKTVRSFRAHTQFPSEGVATWSKIPGIGWSDHWSFWQEGYDAVMVTDTAPFRYPHYHMASDTPDKIRYEPFARVVSGLRNVVEDLAGPVVFKAK